MHYAALTYRTLPGAPPAHMAVGWWGEMPFGPHLLNLCRMRGFEATVEFGPAPLPGGTRGELADQAARAIGQRFVPVWRKRYQVRLPPAPTYGASRRGTHASRPMLRPRGSR